MSEQEKKITVELIGNAKKAGKKNAYKRMTNPISADISDTDKLVLTVKTVLDNEIPMLKNNSLIHDLVLYTLLEKVKTVQTVQNVLSYIKESNAKSVQDVYFKNGEIYIKCLT